MLPQRVVVDPDHPRDVHLRDAVADHRLDSPALLVIRAESGRHQHDPF